MREAGTFSELLCALDRRRLTVEETRRLAELLLEGQLVPIGEAADPSGFDAVGFLRDAARAAARSRRVANMRTLRQGVAVDVLRLRAALGVGLLEWSRALFCPCRR